MNASSQSEPVTPIRLTQYSHGAGCGCKIAPSVLEQILQNSGHAEAFSGLLVGHESKDDAAVFDLGNGTGVISTTDFFMPIVDDAFTFGQIAAVNSISDVYAMGGTPLMAIAILGWPINKLDAELAGRVVAGGRDACRRAGIPLAGGHSIDAPEPIFGLAVTGHLPLANLKQNNTATVGCKLFLTKPLGVGLLTTMAKAGKITEEQLAPASASMTTLNKPGQVFGTLAGVKAMTDVTGFGLLGHLIEMCQGSNVAARIRLSAIPRLPGIDAFLDMANAPGGTRRNLASYEQHVNLCDANSAVLLADPQTSGGLLVAVEPEAEAQFLEVAAGQGLELTSFGEIIEAREGTVFVAVIE